MNQTIASPMRQPQRFSISARRPLKQPGVYPSVRQKKSMTIAAALPYENGILLCAESEHTGFAMKFNAPKIGYFSAPCGPLIYTYAGNSEFAAAAVQKCAAAVVAVKDPDKLSGVLEKAHSVYYRKMVSLDPADASAAYWLLLCYRDARGKLLLWKTHESSIRRATGFCALGIGLELATYLVRPTYDAGLSEINAVHLAAYMLDRVKSHVPGCGGPSQFVLMRNDGSVHYPFLPQPSNIEQGVEQFERLAQDLFLSVVNVNETNAVVRKKLAELREWAIKSRELWRIQEQMCGGPISLTISPGPRHPTDEPSHPQPLPESSAASDES